MKKPSWSMKKDSSYLWQFQTVPSLFTLQIFDLTLSAEKSKKNSKWATLAGTSFLRGALAAVIKLPLAITAIGHVTRMMAKSWAVKIRFWSFFLSLWFLVHCWKTLVLYEKKRDDEESLSFSKHLKWIDWRLIACTSGWESFNWNYHRDFIHSRDWNKV